MNLLRDPLFLDPPLRVDAEGRALLCCPACGVQHLGLSVGPDSLEPALALLTRLQLAEAEVEHLRALNASLAARVAAQSELLSRRAEKETPR
jgi:hypothetical protein